MTLIHFFTHINTPARLQLKRQYKKKLERKLLDFFILTVFSGLCAVVVCPFQHVLSNISAG